MKDYTKVTWEELNEERSLSPIIGLNAVTIKQAAEWMGVTEKRLQAPKTKIRKELGDLGMFVATWKQLEKRLGRELPRTQSGTYIMCTEDGGSVELPACMLTYLTAPAVARLYDEVNGTSNGCVGNHAENFEVKLIPFMGDELMAARDRNGEIWAGVRWMCEGIGLTEDQMKHERNRIQTDVVLCSSGLNLTLNKNGYGMREVLCIKLDFVPLWLAKIGITPEMQREKPEVANKLIQYQLRAKDVLATAFLPQYAYKNDVSEMSDNEIMARALMIAQSTIQKKDDEIARQAAKIERDRPAVEFANGVMDARGTVSVGNFAKATLGSYNGTLGPNQMFKWLRDQKYLKQDNCPYQPFMNQGYFDVIPVVKNGHTYMQPRITGKGQVFLHERLKEYFGGVE